LDLTGVHSEGKEAIPYTMHKAIRPNNVPPHIRQGHHNTELLPLLPPVLPRYKFLGPFFIESQNDKGWKGP